MNIDNKCYPKHKLSQHKLSYLQGYTPSETLSLGLDSVNGTGTQLPRKFNASYYGVFLATLLSSLA